jgi:hypothetical protein
MPWREFVRAALTRSIFTKFIMAEITPKGTVTLELHSDSMIGHRPGVQERLTRSELQRHYCRYWSNAGEPWPVTEIKLE